MTAAGDPWNLQRFLEAQAGVHDRAMAELRSGRKRSHWMWFVFPQLKGLGFSGTSRFYGIDSLEEAGAYVAHPVLGPRLREAVEAVQSNSGATLHQLFGSPDDLKFRSSMTLFEAVEPDGPFGPALERWCGGRRDARTLALLQEG